MLLSADLSFVAAADAALTLRIADVEGVETLQLVDTFDPGTVFASEVLANIDGSAGPGAYIDANGFNLDLTLDGSLDASRIAGGVLFEGGAGTGTLVAGDGDNVWNLTAEGRGDVNGVLFRGVENLVGGAGRDTFVLGEAGRLGGSLSGGGGVNVLDYGAWSSGISVDLATGSASGLGGISGIRDVHGGAGDDLLHGDGAANLLSGGAGNDTFLWSAADTLVGGEGNDTLRGPNLDSSWSVGWRRFGTLNGASFSGVENLVGGSGRDEFRIERETFEGSIAGGGGIDTLVAADTANQWRLTQIDGGELNGGTFSGVENLIGGAGVDSFVLVGSGGVSGSIQGGDGLDTLQGADRYNFWNITGQNEGQLNGQSFSGIENLSGGAAQDMIVLSHGAGVSGSIEGNEGIDTLDYSAWATGVNVDLAQNEATGAGYVSGIQNAIGGAGADRFVGDGSGNAFTGGAGDDLFVWTEGASIIGGQGSDTLVGPDAGAIWAVTALNVGQVEGVGFVGVENLTGGAGDDLFSLADGAGISGLLDGGDGFNTLDYTAYTTAVLIGLSSATATGTGGARNLRRFQGGSGDDTLVGPTADATWNLTGVNEGTVNGAEFRDIENLKGGAGKDVFAFDDGARVDGTLDGGGGLNTLDYSAYSTGVTVDLGTKQATGTGGFSKIGQVKGGAGSDTLIGPLTDTRWYVTGQNAGNLPGVTFSGIENLRGAANNQDTFVILADGDVTGTLEGGAGGFDTVEVRDGNYSSLVFSPTGPDAGSIGLDAKMIVYTGMEPVMIMDTGVAPAIVFNLPNTDDQLEFRHDGGGMFTLDSLNATFEDHTIAVGGGLTTFTINLGEGNDSINFTNLDGTNVDGKLIVSGGLGNDTFSFDTDFGALTLLEAVGEGDDTLDFQPYPGGISITQLGGGGRTINGDTGDTITMDATAAANIENLENAEVALTTSIRNTLLAGLDDLIGFARNVAAFGDLAAGLPLLGGAVGDPEPGVAQVTVAKALDIAEALEQLQSKIEQVFRDVPNPTTDDLLTALTGFTAAAEHLGPAVFSSVPTTAAFNPLSDVFDFTLNLTTADGPLAPIMVHVDTVVNISQLAAGILAELTLANALDKVAVQIVDEGMPTERIAFRVLDPAITQFSVSGANEAADFLGFGTPKVLDNVQDVLRNLGTLNVSLASGVTLDVDMSGPTPKLRLNVDYQADRTSEFNYDFGQQAQALGLGFNTEAKISVDALLRFDFALGLDLTLGGPEFFLDIDALRGGVKTSASTITNVDLNVGFLSAKIGGDLSMEAGAEATFGMASGLNAADLGGAVGSIISGLTLTDFDPTDGDGDKGPSFLVDLDVTVNGELNSLGGFVAPGVNIQAGGSPFGSGGNISITPTNFDELFNFNNLNAAGVISILSQLGGWLDSLRESDLISSLNIPFVEGGLDQILDFAEVLNDALLYDDGADDQVDGSDRLVNDLNLALISAGIADYIRAEADPMTKKISFVKNDPSVTAFQIQVDTAVPSSDDVDTGGYAELGFTGSPSISGLKLQPLKLTATNAAPNFGQLTDDVGITFKITREVNGVSTGVVDYHFTMLAAVTSNNASLGDDRPKLIDAQNAPRFDTAQKLAFRLGEILAGFAAGDAAYDPSTDDLTYDIDFSNVPLFDVELPVDFDLPLGPLGSISSDTRLILSATGGVHLKLGFAMGSVPGAGTLTPASTIGTSLLDDVMVDIKDAPAAKAQAAPRTIVGVLGGDATFVVSVDGGPQNVSVTVPLNGMNGTADNTSIANLVSDIQMAVNGTALNGLIQVQNEDNTIKLVRIGGSTKFSLTTTQADPAFRDVGFQQTSEAVQVGGVWTLKAGKPAPSLVGRLDVGDAMFQISINGGPNRTVTVAKANTDANRNILDLVSDVQNAVKSALTAAGEMKEILVQADGKNLLFTLKDESTGTFTITPGTRADQLGITGALTSDEADLIITLNNGVTHRVTLDGATTIQHVIDMIEAQTGNDIDVQLNANDPSTPADESNTGLTLIDTTPGSGQMFMVQTANGSAAGVNLGIIGMDKNPVDAADVADKKIVGAAIAGPSLLDRFYIQGNPDLADVLDANITIAAGLVVEEIETVLGGGGMVIKSGALFTADHIGKTIHIKGVAGFTEGDYTINAVNGMNEATLNASVGPEELMGGVGLLETGVQAQANFGFVGIKLSGEAGFSADASLGFNTNHMALADNRLTLQELVDNIGDVLNLLTFPDLTPTGPNFGLVDLEVEINTDIGGVDFASAFGGLLDVNPSIMLTILALGDPFLGTRFEQAAYTKLGDAQFRVDGDFTSKLPNGVKIQFNGTEVEVTGTSFSSGKTTVNVMLPGSFVLPASLASVDVVLLPKVDFAHSGLGDLLDFENVNFGDIITALRAFIGFLQGFENAGFFNESIPLINQSPKDLLSFVDEFLRALDEAEGDPAGALQFLETKLKDAIGISQSRINDILTIVGEAPGTDVVELSLDGDILRFDLTLGTSFSKSLGVNIPGIEFLAGTFADLGLGDILELSGSTGLFAEGGVLFELGFGVDLMNPSDVYLFNNTGLKANISVGGDDIAFRAGLGPFVLSIAGTEAMPSFVRLGLDGSFELDPGVFTGNKVLVADVIGDVGAAIDPPTISGTIEGSLPVFFPTDSQHIGTVKIGKGSNPDMPGLFSDLFDGAGLQLKLDPGDVIPANSVVIDVSPIVGAITNFPFENLDIFSSIFLAIDGLDLVLGSVQNVLDSNLGENSLPVVGNDLAKGAKFIKDFREDFIGKLRKEIENVKDFAVDLADPDENIISKILFDLLGPLFGANLLESQSGLESAPSDFIMLNTNLDEFLFNPESGIEMDEVFIEWDLTLGSTLLNQDFGIGFDLGIPGLGLKTEGDIQLNVEWQLKLGFGLSFADGFYLKIGDGDMDPTNDIPELLFDASLTGSNDLAITGTLGFLGLTAANSERNVLGATRTTGLGALFKVDIQNGSDPLDARLGFSEFGNLKFDAGVAANADAILDLNVGLSEDLVGPTLASGFPSIQGEFNFVWGLGVRNAVAGTISQRAMASTFIGFDEFSVDAITDGLKLVEIANIGLNLGEFVSDVLGPIVDKVAEFLEPLQPIIDFLTSPVPVIGAFVDFTWLDLAAAFGNIDTSLIEQIAEIIQLIGDIADASGSTLVIPIGDITIYSATESVSFLPNISDPNFDPTSLLDTAPINNIIEDLGLASVLGGAPTGGAADEMAKSTMSNLTSGGGAFSFPFLENPSEIFGLLLNKDATLVLFDIAPLSIEFEWSQFFTIFGPLGVSIGLTVGISFDSAVGYDTFGIRRFIETGARNPIYLLEGFFISDAPNPSQSMADAPELVFSASLFATAELNLGIARAGIKAELGFKIEFDLNDPNEDGKVRIAELVGNFLNQARLGGAEALLAPLAIFDVRGEIFALMEAFLIIDFGFFTFEEEFPIFGPVTLLDFEIDFFRPPIFASEQENGDLLVHAGKFADQRLRGTASDVAEHLIIESDGTAGDFVNVKIKSGNSALGPDSQEFVPYKVKKGSTIIIDGGEGDDTFDLSGFTEDDVLFQIDGGAGNDHILLNPTMAGGVANKFSTIRGGKGDDEIIGSAGSDLIYGDEGNDDITAGDGDDLVIGDDAEIIGGTVRGLIKATDGGDTLRGGDGSDILIGSGGVDTIYADEEVPGSTDPDLLIGGGGLLNFTSASAFKTYGNLKAFTQGAVKETENLAFDSGAGDHLIGSMGADHLYGTAGPDTIEGGGGNDIIIGFLGKDTIDGGDGNDTIFGDGGAVTTEGNVPFSGGDPDVIQGGAGNDTIYAGGGADLVQGGDDDDTIFGGAGPDIIFGDNGELFDVGGTKVPTPTPYVLNMGLPKVTMAGPGDGNDTIFGEGEPDRIFGGGGNDKLEGGAGPDIIKGGFGEDLLKGKQSSDILDGEEDSDGFRVEIQGGMSSTGFMRIFDTGTVGIDIFIVIGTVFDDEILVRSNTAGTVAFIAQINSEIAVERFDYNSTIERIVINASFGDDYVAVDDSVAEITINGEFGNDRFQVGQLFRDQRIPDNVAVGDDFATIQTTRGWLSNGISAPMTINGGVGEDYFTVFHNKAVLQLNGGDDDDTFEIRAFALAGSQEPQRERTDISGGQGADLVQYAVNAPVNIDGGDGFDTLIIIGTEFGDDFVITEDGVFGAGLNVNFVNIESLRVDGAEGDDRFFVKSTSEKFVTEIFGGLGDDTFNLSGDTPPVVSNDLKGHSGLVLHSVESNDPLFNEQKLFGISANVADNDEPFAVIRPTAGSTIIGESGVYDEYEIVLTRAPTTDVLISALAPIPTPDDRELRAMWFRVETGNPQPGSPADGSGVILKFDASDWYEPQTIRVFADDTTLTDNFELFTRPELGDSNMFQMNDEAYEGLKFGIVNHLIKTQSLVIDGFLTEVSNGSIFPSFEPTTVSFNDPGGFADNDLLGRFLFIKDGPGIGTTKMILGVEEDSGVLTVTLDSPFLPGNIPTNASQYQVRFDDSIVGTMTSFQEDPFVGMDPDDHRSIFADSNANFPTDGEGLRGRVLEIIGGPGVGQERLILGHVDGDETTQLILNGPWYNDPTTSSIYRIKRYNDLAIPSMSIQIEDNDRGGIILDETRGYQDDGDSMVNAGDVVDDYDTVTAVIEAGDGDQRSEWDVLNVSLSRQPGDDVTVHLLFNGQQLDLLDIDGNPISALTFTNGNWNTPQSVVVKATADLLREGFHTSLIQFQIESSDLADPDTDSDVTVQDQVDMFNTIPETDPVYYVGLSFRPIAGTVSVTVDEGDGVQVLNPATQFLVIGNKIVFTEPDGDLLERFGDITVTYDYTNPGFDTAFLTPVLARIADADAPTVLVRESGGSTDVIEARRGGGLPESIPAGFFDANVVDQSPWNDRYELVLTGQPTDDVTVLVHPEVTKTTRTGGIRHDRVQVRLSSVDPRVVAETIQINIAPPNDPPIFINIPTGNLIVTFDDTNWDQPVEIKVRAIDDLVVDGGDTKEFAPGPNAVSTILGPVIIDGAGGQGSLNIGFPLMLPGETNIKPKDGDVVSVVGTDVTVLTSDLQDVLFNLGLDDEEDLVNKTIEVTSVQDEENLFHSAITQFRLILAVSVQGMNTVLTINAPFNLNLNGNEDETEADIKGYAITQESLNFFVDETTQIDFLFVHDEDSPADHSGTLTANRIFGMNMGPDLVIGGRQFFGGVTYGNLEVIEINLGTGNNDFTVLGTPTRTDGYRTWTLLNTGNDIPWMGVQGDTVTVRLNKEDEVTATGTVVSAQNANSSMGIFSSTVTVDTVHADGALAGQIIRIVEDGLGENGAEADGQERRIMTNIGSLLILERPWEHLPENEVYEIINEADGGFAVNTEGGDDTVDASASSADIVMFGGLGADTLIGGSGNDIIFGDRGRVDYFDFNEAIVTRLGDAPEPITGFVTTQVDMDSLNMIIDSGAMFPLPDDVVDGMGTDDTGLIGLYVDINNGTGFLQTIRRITGNTANTLTITPDFDTEIDLPGPGGDIPSEYRISTIPENQTDGVVRAPGLLITIDNDQGGIDDIQGGAGNDTIFGGAAGDIIQAGDGNDVVLGDAGRIDRSRDPMAPEELVRHSSEQGEVVVASFFDRIRTISWADGGSDTISGNAGADWILGGNSGDTIYGDDASDSSGALDGNDIILGDQGEIELVDGVINQVFTTDETEATGGADTIFGGDGDDVILGGVNGSSDELHGGADNDIILGDNGRLIWDDQADPDLSTLDVVQTEDVNLGGDDLIFGDGGDDLIFGATGSDRISAGADDDIALGDFGRATLVANILTIVETTDRTDGAADTIFGDGDDDLLVGGVGDDRIDGDLGHDMIFGDQLVIMQRALGAITDPRFQALLGSVLYSRSDLTSALLGGPVPGGDNSGALLVDGTARDYRNADGTVPAWSRWQVVNLFHSAAIENGDVPELIGSFGNDYLAGGGDDDVIFGQLGDDVIQGDGSIDQLDQGGDPVSADRDPSNPDLLLVPSFEAATDGDDYIEGGGGSDIIFGGLGQDDIVGGSSDFYTLITSDLRPDGHDILFGGAGTRTGRNDFVGSNFGTADDDAQIALEDRHSRDSDVIAGDNARIHRIVGTNGTDSGGILAFEYDKTSAYENRGDERIVVRGVTLLDYTPGGVDFNRASALTDIGAGDEVHGESGDDFIYGQMGADLLYGDADDDDIIGGYGNDWISGGTGIDGVLGDDGRIFTSRNIEQSSGPGSMFSEPLYGVLKVDEVDKRIDTPGDIQVAFINADGALKKTVDLTPFNLSPNGDADDPLYAPLRASDIDAGDPDHDALVARVGADDVIFGGLGNDFLHGGAGDDAISGAEALSIDVLGGVGPVYLDLFFEHPTNPGNALQFSGTQQGIFAAYDEFHPLQKIFVDANGLLTLDGSGDPWFLNFDASEGPIVELVNGTAVRSDGDDAIFGDLGNDWIVGGTGRDTSYGGYGNDLLNADDNLDSTAGTSDALANNVPDTAPTYEDRAFGGAGLDVLIGNTGGDRLIDWVGEFNSFLVPFAPFGLFTVSRMLMPHLPEFLYDLSEAHGADPTRIEDNGSTDRNGEPEGEMGLVLQKDADWNNQTGAPRDVQPGNIPGGPRDVLRSADFNNGNAEGFTPDSGLWEVRNGGFEVRPTEFGGDAVSVFFVNRFLPSYFELQATVSARKVGSSASGGDANNANAFLIFDYQSPEDFKFAGISVKRDKLQMGHRDATGWHVDVELGMQLRPDTAYNMLLALNGTTATLLVDGTSYLSHTFAARVDADGFAYGLNAGMVGIGSNNSVGRIDNVRVQKLPPEFTLQETNDFAAGAGSRLSAPAAGSWQAVDGRLDAAPTAGQELAMNLIDLGLAKGLQVNSVLDLEARLNTGKVGGLVFDVYGPQDFKFVALNAETGQVIVGHHSSRGGWSYDAVANRGIQAGQDYTVTLALRGTSVSVSIDGQLVTGFGFNAPVLDGGFGLMSAGGPSSFDEVTFKTNDPAFIVTGGVELATNGTLEVSLAAESTQSADDGGLTSTSRTRTARIDTWVLELDDPDDNDDRPATAPTLGGGALDALLAGGDNVAPALPSDLSRDWLIDTRKESDE